MLTLLLQAHPIAKSTPVMSVKDPPPVFVFASAMLRSIDTN
jgi:hypothetical protein